MALSNTRTTPYSNILHPNKDTQTTPVGRPIVSGSDGPVATKKLTSFVYKLLQPMCTTTKVISERYNGLHQFLRKNEGSRKHNPCFHGFYELVYKYTKRGGNEHSVQRIKKLPQN